MARQGASVPQPDPVATDARRAALARLPQVQRLLELAQAELLCQRFRREDVVQAMRTELARLRAGLLAGSLQPPQCDAPIFLDHFFEAVQRSLEQRHQPSLRRVINATGVVLHTNLGRAPLAPEALAAMASTAAGYCNLEFQLKEGERGSRHAHVAARLCQLTGAEAALVVNNCAAAVLLCLMAFAQGGEVVVSRGELIEIGGAFRMPDVIAQSGARLVEVGTTNKTRLDDYAQAITPQTRVLLKSHPSNYRIVGFSEGVERRALAQLAAERNLLLIEDLGSGTLVDMRRYGLPHEPTVQHCLREGVHLVLFSGDKLLGGPQAGIIVGRAAEIAQLKRHPLLRALRMDKLSLAALEATLALYQSPAPPEQRVPVLRMLAEDRASIARRARRLAAWLRRLPKVRCEVVPGTSLAGGGSLPGAELPTMLLRLTIEGLAAQELARRLRLGQPALVGRLLDDHFVMDVRTVTASELREILEAVTAIVTAVLAAAEAREA